MKNIKYLFYIIAAVFTLGLSSCSSEEYKPGDPDLENCHQVSFVVDNQNEFELDPKAETALTFKAKRISDVGSITVPVTVKDTSGIFEVAPIEFEDGQEETEFVVSFDQAKVGTKYQCTLSIDDPEYASIYTNEQESFTFLVTRVKWDQIIAGDGSKFGLIRDGIVCETYGGVPMGTEAPVEVFMRADRPGLFKLISPYGAPMLAKIFGATPEQVQGNVRPTEFIINATDPNKVWIPIQDLGCVLNQDDGFLLTGSDVKENGSPKESYGFWDQKTNVITFPVNGLLVGLESMPGKYFNVNGNGLARVILPGGQPIDYTVAAQAGLSKEGKLPVQVVAGADVAKIKYASFVGSLASADVPYKAKDIVDGKVEGSKELEGAGPHAIELEFDKTGVYTVVFASINANGEFTEKSTSVEVKYVVAGDEEKHVQLDCGLIISDKHAKEGLTAENSAEVWISGNEIETIQWGLYKLSDFQAKQEETLKELVATEPMSAEDVASVNEGVFSGIADGLNSGTDYILLVYASNGYEASLFQATAKTEGRPDPRFDEYTMESFVEELVPSDMDAYCGDYNLYGFDVFDKAQTQRKILAESSISHASDTTLSISNMLPALGKFSKEATALEFQYMEGVLGSMPADLKGLTIKNGSNEMFAGAMWMSPEGGLYNGALPYGLIASYVADGIIAFVPNAMYIEQYKINIVGAYVGAFSDAELKNHLGGICGYKDYLLVRKDLDADAAAVVAQDVVQNINKSFGKIEEIPVNFVETEQARLASYLESLKHAGAKDFSHNFTKTNKVEIAAKPVAFKSVLVDLNQAHFNNQEFGSSKFEMKTGLKKAKLL